MATLKNENLNALIGALNALMDTKVPVTTALKIRKIHHKVAQQHEDVEAVRAKLIEDYAARDEEGNKQAGAPQNGQPTVKIRDEEREAFNGAVRELYSATFEIPVTLTEADFATVNIEPLVLIQLGALVEE